ncbi:MAG: invasin domain 3-containing protein [Gemmatimonadota bacterium]|nr:invasin domain 3-containing protein [Gemmatimonadota bacterium]
MAYDAEAETVLGWILGVEALPAEVRVDAEVWSAGTVMFAGSLETEVVDTAPGRAAEVHDVSLAFVGPGSEAVSITVSPIDSLLTFSDTLRYRVTGVDAEGNTISDVVAVWSSSDPGLAPISAAALLSAPEERGSVRVSAMTPTGLSDSTAVAFQPAAASLVVVEGDGVSAPVRSSVPLEVRVVGADGEGVADVDVSFEAPSGASTRERTVASGPDGHAETVGTLGASAGPYTFVASSAGMASVTLEVTAEPGSAEPGTATIEADPTEVEADGDAASTITVQLYDADGNPLTEGGDEVTLTTDLGELTEVTDNGDGTYTAELRSADEGEATVTGTLNGEPIDDQASVTFTTSDEPTGPTAAFATITAEPIEVEADGDAASTITVQLYEADETPLTEGGDEVTLSTGPGRADGGGRPGRRDVHGGAAERGGGDRDGDGHAEW